MPYKNVKTQNKALKVEVERLANGFTVTPKYEGASWETSTADHAKVFTRLEDALSEAKAMLATGITVTKEEWFEAKDAAY